MKFERILKRQKFEIRNLRWFLSPFQPQCVCSAMYRYWAALLSNEPAHSSDVRDSWDLVNCCLTTTTHCVCFSFCPPVGTLHTRVQIQGVCVWELLRDVLLHDISAAAVGQGLVPRSEQGRGNHEGEPRQEEQASGPLPPQASQR